MWYNSEQLGLLSYFALRIDKSPLVYCRNGWDLYIFQKEYCEENKNSGDINTSGWEKAKE